MDAATAENAAEQTLRLAYEDRVREATRLRDARRGFTTQLGLPASASLAVSAIAAFSEDINRWFLALALIPFVVAVGTGVLFSGHEPYRSTRKRVEEEGIDWLSLSPKQWLIKRTRDEETIYGELERNMERERLGVQLVQLFVVVQIVVIILAAA
jgi:hypothetical protein